MAEPLPIVLVPGLFATPRFFDAQIPALWSFGPVTIADHTRDDAIDRIAQRILAYAPARFALVGHSMGGYIAFEMMRHAADRVLKLALLDTSARADTPEQSERRRIQIALAEGGRFAEIPDLQFPNLVDRSRHRDEPLRQRIRQMAQETGAAAFVRQQTAMMTRPDSRPGLGTIRCTTLVLVGDNDEVTPPDRASEIADAIRGSRLVTVPACGHMCALEQPNAVTDALKDWLER